MRNFDLVFAGNGIISVVSALELKKRYPDVSVAIVGKKQRPFSASFAAGAMQAVFCEVEETFNALERDREIFHIGLEARPLWHEFLKEFGLQDVVTAQSTVMYRRKQGTLFEEANFEAACSVAADYKCLEQVGADTMEKIFHGNIKPADVVAKKFAGEFAMDTEHFFSMAQSVLEKIGVVLIDDKVLEIENSSQGSTVSLQENGKIGARKIVIAAGTESTNLVPNGLPMVQMYHAVGTAMVLDSAPAGYSGIDAVVRTPNRGGAQCGMHIVPRNFGKFYLGAGNYLSDKTPAHRVETIRYLIDICQEELFGKQVIYNAKAELLLGSRPKSVDGYPIIGSYENCPDIFVATGTYRIGLTIAPVIAQEICLWYGEKQESGAFKKCSPARELHSYASMDVATRYYSESRISNLIEHGLLDIKDSKAIADKKIELESIAKKFNADIVSRHGFSNDFVADPDMYTMLMEAEPIAQGKQAINYV